MSVSIADIKKEYKKTGEFGLLDYEKELEALYAFAEKYEIDERSGVKATVSSAEKKINSIRNEIERVKQMMQFEEKYGSE